jgi:hypothetical protein
MAHIPELLDQGLVTARDPAMLENGELTVANNVHYKPHDRALHKTKQRTKYNTVAITGSPVVKGLRFLEFDHHDSLLLAMVSDDLYLSSFTDETGSFGTPILGVGDGTSLDAIHFENKYYLLTGVGENHVISGDRTVRRHSMQPVNGMGPTPPAITSGVFNSGLGTGYFYFIVTEVSNPDTADEVESAFNGTPETTNSAGVPIQLTSPTTQAIQITRPPLTNVIVVESVTADGSTTLTSAAAFSKVRVGQLLTGTGVPVNTYVDTVTDESTITVTNAVTLGTITVTFYIATHWRIYMSPAQEFAVPPVLSLFRRVGQEEITSTTVILGSKTDAEKFPTANTTHSAGFSNPNNAHTIDNIGTRVSVDAARQGYRTFAFATSGTIIGIEVRIRFRVSFNPFETYPLILVNLMTDATADGNAKYPGNKGYILNTRNFTSGGLGSPLGGAFTGYVTATLGSPTDRWGKSGGWSTAEINNATFGVQIRYGEEDPSKQGMVLDIDAVSIIAYTSGGTNNPIDLTGAQYRTISISVGGLTSLFSQAGPAPIAFTGDVFEDQFVVNDVTDPSVIRYSMPGKMHYFPAPFYLNFETRTADEVTCIRKLGNKLIVGLKTHLFRVNYLPRETDAEFDRGRPSEPISESHGIVGRQAACLFNPDDTSLMLAYVSHNGVHMTDGFTSTSLTTDLDWPATVRLPIAGDVVNYLENAVLVDDPHLQILKLFYTPPGQTTNTKALYFHYNKYHRKANGTFKVTGPIDVVGRSAHLARLAGNTMMLTGQTGGFVYVEDRGYTDASGSTPTVDVRTREIYPAGLGNHATVNTVYARKRQSIEGGAGGSTITVTPFKRDLDGAQVSVTGLTFTTAQAGVAKIAHKEAADSFQLRFTEPGGTSGLAMEALVLDVESKGDGRTK